MEKQSSTQNLMMKMNQLPTQARKVIQKDKSYRDEKKMSTKLKMALANSRPQK